VKYLFGMTQNRRPLTHITPTMKKARLDWASSGRAARRYIQFSYRRRNSWSRGRRVVTKAEYLDKGENPRFVVTNLSSQVYEAQMLHEKVYCARREMENRIKEQQLYLFADRISSATMRANQLRLWFSSLSYVILNELRRVGHHGTRMDEATCASKRPRGSAEGREEVAAPRSILVTAGEYRRVASATWEPYFKCSST
jgi:hypothetical protein